MNRPPRRSTPTNPLFPYTPLFRSELRAKRQAGQLNFERVILETTGMANPGPVCQTFFMDDEIAEYYRLDAVVTVVDAKHGMATLDAQPERSEEHTSELQSLMRTSYAVFCLQKKNNATKI